MVFCTLVGAGARKPKFLRRVLRYVKREGAEGAFLQHATCNIATISFLMCTKRLPLLWVIIIYNKLYIIIKVLILHSIYLHPYLSFNLKHNLSRMEVENLIVAMLHVACCVFPDSIDRFDCSQKVCPHIIVAVKIFYLEIWRF